MYYGQKVSFGMAIIGLGQNVSFGIAGMCLGQKVSFSMAAIDRDKKNSFSAWLDWVLVKMNVSTCLEYEFIK
jgi:hypothetical protein